ncbi:MAG: hypothetical protein J6A69_13000 [Clostridia bacterium]|nr:hypothetical protein [Clostridia bacterium]
MKKMLNPVHGVGNGPGVRNVERRINLFKEAGIQYSRTHDPVGGFGSGEFVNIHCIFKNFDADVNDPASYDFQMTDIYIKNIIDAGTKVIYRLGETIENGVVAHPELRKYCKVPADFQKWAEICEHIVMHYNEGWNNGFHYNIEYWEIWNEPDNIEMWDGTDEEFYEMYRITANHLKNRFPNIKIGGYGCSGLYAALNPDNNNEWFKALVPYFENFVKYITAPETKAPFDFFSWHCYTRYLEEFEHCMKFARSYLDSHGLSETESILTEWNVGGECIDGVWESSIFRKGPKAASFVAGVFSLMNQYDVDKSNYYDAEATRVSWCGLFDVYTGNPCKPYFVFKAYNELYNMENKFDFEIEDRGALYSIGAEKDGEKALMLSNYKGVNYRVNIPVEKIEGCKMAEIYAIDENHDLELTEKVILGKTGLEVSVNTNTVIYIKFR